MGVWVREDQPGAPGLYWTLEGLSCRYTYHRTWRNAPGPFAPR